MYASLIDS